MDIIKSSLEKKYKNEELQKLATILNRKYRVSYFLNGWQILEETILNNLDIDINQLKSQYHYSDIFNFIIMNYGKTEAIIKYYLTKEFINNQDEVCLYEFPIGNSRVDFARINGKSYAYEIKTEIDTTARLEQQIQDYLTAFEYIIVVTHKKHIEKVKKLVPKKVGILEYVHEDSLIKFNEIRAPKYNRGVKKNKQLENLTSEELKYIIKCKLNVDVPPYKKQRSNLVNRKLLKNEFNECYKQAIKNSKYRKWKHIKNNFDVLKPIDIQYVYTDEFNIRLLS